MQIARLPRRHCKKPIKSLGVIPAKAGIHSFHVVKKTWIPFFKGMTTFCSDILPRYVRKGEGRLLLNIGCPEGLRAGGGHRTGRVAILEESWKQQRAALTGRRPRQGADNRNTKPGF
jgi:RNase adaptor protein for sRNA GlmZ degradation